ncbi:hypothetical protein [Streptomyces sp. NPDC096311]|uniref:hypothetical protein n=1 Tax=Streptomyces sp. NPDC096311 TaxID=3366083 RepID=UPI00381FE525
MTDEQEVTHTPNRAPTPPRWPRLLFRIVITGEALLALDQAALAGGFLSGNYSALGMHAAGAAATALAAVLLTITAVLLWRPGRGPGWPAVASAVLFTAEGVEIGLGYGRVLALHVPLGTAIIASALLMLVWAWRPVRQSSEEQA